ncbi:hypothetical protein R1flu_015055 [Riccia fluitans]|uniref:Uncharacterized protein n=1 Tax=Riccia fluitans TaxID=41844 RepID=A0ABD1YL56_9MARC
MSKTNMNNSVSVGIAVQADWDNRHFSNSLSLNVRRLFEFLLQFETSTKTSPIKRVAELRTANSVDQNLGWRNVFFYRFRTAGIMYKGRRHG